MPDMKYQIQVGYVVDDAGLKRITSSLRDIQNQASNLGANIDLSKISQLQDMIKKSSNMSLGQINVGNFVNSIKKAGMSVSDLKAQLVAAGPAGITAFNSISNAIMRANIELNQTPKFLQKFGETFINVMKYNISGAIMNNVTGSIQQALGFVKSLDTSLNDIRIVTDKSAESMANFSRQASAAAKELGKSTTDYTEASLIYYQQGLGDEEVKARTETTLKAANVTGQSTAEVSDELTAVWNGYQIGAADTEKAVDKLAAVAATTSSDLEELSVGMSKVASAANTMGVDFDQLNAQLATIVSVTRQAPESVGTALKTIYARMSTIQAGGTDDEGNSLTSYTEKMNNFGISVLDQQGNLREMGEVMEEVGQKWQFMNKEQKVSLAQAMAGTRQYNNLMALFENWGMYNDALKTSQDSLGALQKQQDIYMDSLQAHYNQLETAKEEVFSDLIDEDSIKSLVDTLTNIVEALDSFIKSFGNGIQAIMGMVAMMGPLFQKQLANGLIGAKNNIMNTITNRNIVQAKRENIGLTEKPIDDDIVHNGDYYANEKMDKAYGQLEDSRAYKAMSQEEFQETSDRISSIGAKQRSNYYNTTSVLQAISGTGAEAAYANSKEINNPNYKITKDDLMSIEKIDIMLGKVVEESEEYREMLSDANKELKEAEEHYRRIASNTNHSTEELAEAKKAKDAALANRNEVSTSADKWDSAVLALENQKASLNEVQGALDQEEKTYKEIANERLGITEITSNLANTMQMLVGTYSSIVSLQEIWTNKSNDVLDIITQISVVFMTQMLPAIIQTVSTFNKMKAASTGVSIFKGVGEGAGSAIGVGISTAVKKGGAAISKAGTAIAGFLTNPITIGFAAALGAILAGIKLWDNHQKKVAEESYQAAQKSVELANETYTKAQEENNAVNSLAQAYKDLKDSVDSGSLTKQQAIDKTYDLCMQYGQEDLAIQALCSSYESLDDLILKASVDAKESAYNAGQNLKRALQVEWNNIDNKNQAGKSQNVDINSNQSGAYQEEIESLTGAVYDNRGLSGRGYYDVDLETVAKNYDEIQELLLKDPHDKALIKLNEYMQDHAGVIKQYMEVMEQDKTLLTETAGLSVQNTKINNQNDYQKWIEEQWDANKDKAEENGISEEEYKSLLNEYVLSNEKSLQKYATTESIIEQLVDEEKGIGESREAISDALLTLSEGELKQIALYIDDVESLEDLQNIKNQYDDIKEYIEGNNIRVSIESALGDLADKGEISEESMANLKSQGIVNENFDSMSSSNQMASLLMSDVQAAQKAEEERAAKLEELEKKRQQLIDNKPHGSTRNPSTAMKQYEKNLKAVENEIKQLAKVEVDYTKKKQQVNKAYEMTNKTIDSMQSQYKALIDITKDYNANGKLSVDNVQQLITMDNAFVASLEFQGDQLKVNGESYANLMEIQKAYMKQEVLSQMVTDLKLLSEGKVTDATYASGQATEYLTFDIQKATEAALTGTVAMTQYARSVASIAGVELGSITDEEAEVIKAAENKLKLIDAMSLNPNEGSGSSKKKKDDKKEYEDEFDRYWDLKKAIDKVAEALEHVEDLQSHLHGKELIKSLQNENALLKQQSKIYEEMGAEQEKEAEELRTKLGASGFKFDEEGQVLNYKAQTQHMLDEMQAIKDQYNSGGYDEDSYQEAEKQYEKVKKNLERYDELYYSEMKENRDKLRELSNQEIENNLQMWETTVQVQLDMTEAERDWNDFFHNIDTNFKLQYQDYSFDNKTNKKDFDTYTRVGGTLDTDLSAISDVEKEIDVMMAGGESKMFRSVSDAQEKLKELKTQYQEDIQATYDLYQETWENYLSSIDQGADRLEELNNKYKQINSTLEFQSQLITLIYGQKEFDLMNQFYEGQRNNSLAQVDSLKQQRDMWERLYQEAEEGSADKAKYYDLWIQKQNELNEAVITHINLLKNEYTNTIEGIFDTLDKQLSGDKTLNWMSEEWKLAKKSAEGYYDDVERIYELETMESKWESAIEKASTQKSQQKLTDLMNTQLEALREKENLSEYDITLAEKRLAVAQAQAALDDAQNNKNSTKVTRGADGNWSYQYVADEGDLASKQQALLDAQHDAYEYAKKSWEDMQASIISDTNEALESIKKLELEKVGASEEEVALINEKIRTIEETYWGPDGIITQHRALAAQQEKMLNEETAMSLVTSYEVDKNNYELMTTEERALLDELRQAQIDSMQDVYYSTNEVYDAFAEKADEVNTTSLESWTTLSAEIIRQWNSDDDDSVRTNILSALDDCNEAIITYAGNLDILADKAEMDFSEAGIAGSIAKAEEQTNSLTGQTELLVQTIETGLYDAMGVIEEMGQSWDVVRDGIDTAADSLNTYLNMLGVVEDELAILADKIREVQGLGLELTDLGPGSGNGHGIPVYEDPSKLGSGLGTFQYYQQGTYGYWDKTANNGKGNWETISSLDELFKKYFGEEHARSQFYSTTGVLYKDATDSQKLEYMNKYYTSAAATYATAPNTLGMRSTQNAYGLLNVDKYSNYDGYNDYQEALSRGFAGTYEDWVNMGKPTQLSYGSFDTGGYTGSWSDGGFDSNGKLAVLHEKELVLNQEDTTNFLSIVDMLRSIPNLKESIGGMISSAFSRNIPSIGGFAVAGATSAGSTSVFNITAEFPNANDVNEIREAILSLPNLASQYTNQKNK